MEPKYIAMIGLTALAIFLVALLGFGSGKLPQFEDKFNFNQNSTLGQSAPSPSPQITELMGQEIKVGTSAAAVVAGDTIVVHYVGSFLDGKIFDSSRERKEPFEVKVGAQQVIPGFEQGVLGMKIGGVRKLQIPSNLAYGPQGSGPIPPNTPIQFEIELLSIKPNVAPSPSPEVTPEPSPAQ